ncbi:hypothetical protein [Spirosoma endophyticum]|uniref:Uncharacterized protein n=1 Tax=Spirosoma endophyticum TaxID=662367 RepID=A0A1I2H6H0_9BACT|nr:hypothetical protein [Spirosoma endophyticum]SFF25775.1 hypothetical protein SAMN05216167_1399 [Spirosoma endophyticum]
MLIDLDQTDDSPDPERITDPMIRRYAYRLHLLTMELCAETEYYELNREQIDQFINSLKTMFYQLGFAEDLQRLDAVLRLSFPGDYYGENESVISMLTNYPLTTSN